VTVRAERIKPLSLDLVLGDVYPPGPTETKGDATGIISVKAFYPRGDQKRTFATPLAWMGKQWDIGWLGLYLAVYLPVMFVSKWWLRVV
jgi:hypothetical protein